MKKIFATLILALTMTVSVFAKQVVKYYRYNLSLNVAANAQSDLERLIEQGNTIVSFSLDYQQKCMLIVYENNK